jgi:hypothetical protein
MWNKWSTVELQESLESFYYKQNNDELQHAGSRVMQHDSA